MRKSLFIIVYTILASFSLYGQNTILYERLVKELSSEKYQGRGYAYNGVRMAGDFIEAEFKKAGADDVLKQSFTIDINTFPGAMEMSVDNKQLSAGDDFVVREYTCGVKGDFGLYYIDTTNYDSEKLFADLAKPENNGVMVVCDFWFTYDHKDDFRRLERNGGADNAGVIYVWDTPLKFYKAYGEKVSDKPIVWVSPEFPKDAEQVSLNIENQFLGNYSTDNIIAKVEGKRGDSCYVFTAHYDHLGNLGSDVYFPGANDNASGTAAIITLAEYYANNKPEFDIWFVAFSGEDANLRGSNWFVEHPVIPLDNIRYLFNLDMIGDNNPVQYCEISEQGVKGFETMVDINSEKHLFEKLNRGELAANSDHWPFAQKGVPCILFENESGDYFKYYHTPEDCWANTVTSTYESLFILVTESVRQY